MPQLPPENPPGSVQYPFDIDGATAQVKATLADCGQVVDAMLGKLQAAVSECLDACGGTWANCESCITGKVNAAIDRAGAVAAKCAAKLQDRAQQIFNSAVLTVAPVIDKLPPVREVVAQQMIGPGYNAINTDAIARIVTPIPPPPAPPPLPIPPPPVVLPPPMPGPVPPPPPPPSPGPSPVGCATIQQVIGGTLNLDGTYTCPPGTTPILSDDGCTVVCSGTPTPPPGPPPQPTCHVIFPPPPPPPAPPPPCPPPTEPCPTGQEWQYIDGAWQCKPKPPPPPPPPPGPGGPPSLLDVFGLTNWNRLICPPIIGPVTTQETQDIVGIWNQFAGYTLRSLFLPIDSIIRAFSSTAADAFDVVAGNAVANLIINPVGDVLKWLFAPRDCDYSALAAPVAVRALLSFAEHYLDIGLDDVITNLNYTIARACPTELPDQAAVDAAFLGNQIPEDTWRCWTRALDHLDLPAYAAMYTERTQPNVKEWIAAWQRQLITENDLTLKMRNSGVLDPGELTIFKRLMEQLPGASDIVRFMVRNVEDPNIVAPPPQGFGLDAEFNLKFAGILKDWARGQGITDDVMLRFWRAHWVVPSPGQLYTMYHRLRPDNNPNLQVTQADVNRALGENDVLPFWRERLLAISDSLPRLRDVGKFFEYGLWNADQLLDYFRSYGYSLADAKTKVASVKLEIDEKEAKQAQVLTKSQAVNAYVSGAVGLAELTAALRSIGFDDKQIAATVDQAGFLRTVAQRKRILKSIKCGFVACQYGATQAVELLTVNGWDPSDALLEVNCWKQQCAAKPKEITASVLCKWYGDGFISLFEYKTRLARLGFSRDDIDRIIGECQKSISEKAAKAAKGSKNGAATGG